MVHARLVLFTGRASGVSVSMLLELTVRDALRFLHCLCLGPESLLSALDGFEDFDESPHRRLDNLRKFLWKE